MTELNPTAQPFIPESKRLEDEMFDRLESQFIKNNKWLFEDDWVEFEYNLERRFNRTTSPKKDDLPMRS